MKHCGWVEITDTYRFDGEYLWCRCIMPEPHTCPTCDGYGYVNAIIFSDKPTERRDIPCPDCEAECSVCDGSGWWPRWTWDAWLKKYRRDDKRCPDCNAE